MPKTQKDDSLESKFENLKKTLDIVNYDLQYGYNGKDLGFRIWHKLFSEIGILGNVDKTDSRLFLYIVIRTSSWGYSGERTDLHDVYSLILAALFRASELGISCEVWDEPNDFSQIEEELYRRILVVGQPFTKELTIGGNLEDWLYSVTMVVNTAYLIISSKSWITLNKQGTIQYSFKYDDSSSKWSNEIPQKLKHNFAKENVMVYKRKTPNWTYYRNYRKGISFIHSPQFCKFFSAMLSPLVNEGNKVFHTNNGMILHHTKTGTANFINTKARTKIDETMRVLFKNHKSSIIIPVENLLIGISKNAMVFLHADSGKKAYEIEREKLRERHEAEAEFIFPTTNLKWYDKINDDEFEKLAGELLNRMSSVRWVRRSGHSRERDYGKDLLVEMETSPLTDAEAKQKGVLIVRKVVIQCKVSEGGLSKSKVQDIRDCIEHHNAEGYLLVCSNYITGGLSTYLEKLRDEKRFYIDWWGRTEIEERIKIYPDLVKKYSKIFKQD
ncbi:MAG: hypothetical protein JWP69_1685 [Flaviaesturariibacter sp.]|nr:hypothetical protein [Flaviaesturariibacter sp.]